PAVDGQPTSSTHPSRAPAFRSMRSTLPERGSPTAPCVPGRTRATGFARNSSGSAPGPRDAVPRGMRVPTPLHTKLLAASTALELVPAPRRDRHRLRRILVPLLLATLTLTTLAIRRFSPIAQAAAIRGSMAGLLVLHASVCLEW